MTDYHGIIGDSELERIPGRIRRFLFREQAPSDATQSLAFYAYGYTRAFEEMVSVALAGQAVTTCACPCSSLRDILLNFT